MNADLPTPSVARDASSRALRTLVQGLTVDVLVAVGVVLTAAVAAGVEWTRAYWVAFGLAVAKSAVTAILSYLARLWVPPVTPADHGGGGL